MQGRSINMTIAKRGLDTLQRIGMKETVLKDRYVNSDETHACEEENA